VLFAVRPRTIPIISSTRSAAAGVAAQDDLAADLLGQCLDLQRCRLGDASRASGWKIRCQYQY
jgi:hypothetical protein